MASPRQNKPSVSVSPEQVPSELVTEFDLTAVYEVKPGVPVSYELYSEHDGTEVATEPFKAYIAPLDQFGNWCRYLDETQSITFALSGTSVSPSGVSPIISITESITFTPSDQPYPAVGQAEYIVPNLSLIHI